MNLRRSTMVVCALLAGCTAGAPEQVRTEKTAPAISSSSTTLSGPAVTAPASTRPVEVESALEALPARNIPCVRRPGDVAAPGEFAIFEPEPAQSLVPGAQLAAPVLESTRRPGEAGDVVGFADAQAFPGEGVPSVAGIFPSDQPGIDPIMIFDQCPVRAGEGALVSGDWIIVAVANQMGLLSINTATGEHAEVVFVGTLMAPVFDGPPGAWVFTDDGLTVRRFDVGSQSLGPPLDIEHPPEDKFDFPGAVDTEHGLVVGYFGATMLVDSDLGTPLASVEHDDFGNGMLGGNDSRVWRWSRESESLTAYDTATLTPVETIDIDGLSIANYGERHIWYSTLDNDMNVTIGTIDTSTGDRAERSAFVTEELVGRGGPYPFVPWVRPYADGGRFFDESVFAEFFLPLDP